MIPYHSPMVPTIMTGRRLPTCSWRRSLFMPMMGLAKNVRAVKHDMAQSHDNTPHMMSNWISAMHNI